MPSADIIFLRHNEIDKARWDNCITTSPQSRIYARSFYLDNICPGWSALISKDYKWLLPLTHRTKWGVTYLYQPAFTQQLGIFAKPDVTVPQQVIIQWLQQHYKFWEISWNSSSRQEDVPQSIQVTPAVNLVLALGSNYKSLALQYSKDLQQNLRRSKQFNLSYAATADYQTCIDLYRQHYGLRIPHVTAVDYNHFVAICSYAMQHNMLVCREALSGNKEVLAAALLLQDGKRLYNLMNTTTDAGRKVEANHFLLDAIIREFSGKDTVFDFEGSDIPGVKRFYESFGAVNEPYYMLRYNELPWLVRLVKK